MKDLIIKLLLVYFAYNFGRGVEKAFNYEGYY